MKISKKDLEWAATQNVISVDQADELWRHLAERRAQQPHLSAVHVAYYFGAMIVISAMSWFMTLAWEALGGSGIFAIASIYAGCFSLAGWTLWQRKVFQIPGGLLVTIAVGMVPLAIYGLERWLGFWPQGAPGSYRDYHVYIKGSWIVMEVATVVAGVIALRFVRFPFLTAPIAFSLWYMSMDVAPLLFGAQDFSWEQRRWVSVGFGLIILLVAYLVDRRTEMDFAFWGYLFGLLSFWGGLSFMEGGSQWTKAVYCLINLALILASVLLERTVFLVFGALGVFGYLGYLSHQVFQNVLYFPFVLTGVGVGIILAAIQFQKHGERIHQAILQRLPRALVARLPRERARSEVVS